MEKKQYEQPTVQVVHLQMEGQLLQGSNVLTGTQDYNVFDYYEE